jgi:predicted GTPase
MAFSDRKRRLQKAGDSGKKVILAINKADAVAKESCCRLFPVQFIVPIRTINPVSAQKGDA